MDKSKAALAAEMRKEPDKPPPAPKPEPVPERRLPSQFDVAKQIVELVHKEWPHAKMQDWPLFYNALGLAKGELRRNWYKRKREQQPI